MSPKAPWILRVASVKAPVSPTEDLSLHRVDQICDLIGLDLREVLNRALDRAGNRSISSPPRRKARIISDPKLLFMTWLVADPHAVRRDG